MAHEHATPAQIDAAYVAAMRAGVVRTGHKVRPTAEGVLGRLGTGCYRCRWRVVRTMSALHRLHGAPNIGG